MNLTLPKTKSYHYMNEQTIREMCERFKVDPKSVKNHKDLPWEEKYPLYMQDVTGQKPCPVCNGPMKYKPKFALQRFYPNGIVCLDHPAHTVALAVAWLPVNRLLKKNKDTKPEWIAEKYEYFVKAALGPVCEHGEFLVDCSECLSAMQARYDEEQERIDRVVLDAIPQESEHVEMSSVPA